MSQTTRCPSCTTLFKVVPDQLRISDGWVRCGRCNRVFDATLSLQDLPVPVPQPGPGAQLPQAPPPASAADNALQAAGPGAPLAAPESDMRDPGQHQPEADPALDPPMNAPLQDLERCVDGPFVPDAPALARKECLVHGQAPAGDELPGALLPDTQDPWTAGNPQPEAQAPGTWHTTPFEEGGGFPAETAETGETVETPPFSPVFTAASLSEMPKAAGQDGSAAGGAEDENHAPLLGKDTAEPGTMAFASGLPEKVPVASATDAAPALQDMPVPPSPAPAQEPSFVRSARRQALWGTPAARLVLGAVAALLAALLLVQMAVQQRHYLASARPQWRPALEALCVPLQCTVRPYRHIAAVVVDSSSFNKLRGNTYRFALALKNQSAQAVALPAVELTLTDASDQPVLRRVITPPELSAPATLPPEGEWAGSVEMDLGLGGDARIFGYRVLAFYP